MLPSDYRLYRFQGETLFSVQLNSSRWNSSISSSSTPNFNRSIRFRIVSDIHFFAYDAYTHIHAHDHVHARARTHTYAHMQTPKFFSKPLFWTFHMILSILTWESWFFPTITKLPLRVSKNNYFFVIKRVLILNQFMICRQIYTSDFR